MPNIVRDKTRFRTYGYKGSPGNDDTETKAIKMASEAERKGLGYFNCDGQLYVRACGGYRPWDQVDPRMIEGPARRSGHGRRATDKPAVEREGRAKNYDIEPLGMNTDKTPVFHAVKAAAGRWKTSSQARRMASVASGNDRNLALARFEMEIKYIQDRMTGRRHRRARSK